MEKTRLALICVLFLLPLARPQSSSLVCIKSTDDKSGQVCAYQLNTEETNKAIDDLKGELNRYRQQVEALRTNNSRELNRLRQQVEALQTNNSGKLNSLRLKVEALQTNNSANLTAAILRGYMELQDGWIAPFNGYQYKATPTYQSWSASRTLCQQWGGDLDQYGVRDVATRITLYRGLSLYGSHWIGLSDGESEGTWSWLNGNRANPDDGSLWRPGNPSTSDVSECATVYFKDNHGSGLFVVDERCSIALQALCEKEV